MLAYLHLHTLTLAYFALGCFRSSSVCVCECECRSVSVEVSVFKGFSGRTLRNAFGNKVSPRTQKQKEAHNPGKINKHKLAGQNEASAPSRFRGNYDISSIAVLVQHSSTHLPTGFREAWSSTTPTHASFYLCTDPEQPAMMLVYQPCAGRNNPAVSATT